MCYVWDLLFGGLGALQVTLGSLLGLPKAILGVLWTSKTLKNLMFPE